MERKNIIFLTVGIIAILAAASCAVAISAHMQLTDTEVPIDTADGAEAYVELDAANIAFEVEELSEESDFSFDELQEEIQEIISDTQKVTGGEWSVYVTIPKTGDTMSINQRPMQAASVIKIFVMGAVYEEYDEITEYYQYDDIDGLLESMITISDNDATDLLVTMLGRGDAAAGRETVTEFCREYGFTNTTMDRMMGDDNIYSDNYTTTEDCAAFLLMLYNGEFDHSKEMLDLLRGQTRVNKIPEGVPSSVMVLNKTGELDDVQNDVAIVFAKTPYIICVISDGVEDYQSPIDAIVDISETTYEYISDNIHLIER